VVAQVAILEPRHLCLDARANSDVQRLEPIPNRTSTLSRRVLANHPFHRSNKL